MKWWLAIHSGWEILYAFTFPGNARLGNAGLGNEGLGNEGFGKAGLGNKGLGNTGLGNGTLKECCQSYIYYSIVYKTLLIITKFSTYLW